MNSRKTLGIIAAVAALAIAIVGWSFFKPPEEASGPIESQPVSLGQPMEIVAGDEGAMDAMTDDDASAEDASTGYPAPAEGEAADLVQDQDPASDESGVVGGESDAAGASDDAIAPSAGPTVFEILPGASVARFEIDEVLRGTPTHVVGTTDQVAGQIALDPADTSSAQVGEILVNMRTLATDSEFRNRAIKNKILLTDQYEFVRFRPTQVTGLPASLAEGQAVPFQISGDLEIVGAVLPATFEGQVVLTAPNRLEGSASLTILYADYGLTIPASQSVDAVEDDLILALDFVAEAGS